MDTDESPMVTPYVSARNETIENLTSVVEILSRAFEKEVVKRVAQDAELSALREAFDTIEGRFKVGRLDVAGGGNAGKWFVYDDGLEYHLKNGLLTAPRPFTTPYEAFTYARELLEKEAERDAIAKENS